MWSRFSTRVPGKWVLAGEHAVLRGATAVALPHPEFELSIHFEPNGSDNGLIILPKEAEAIIKELLEAVAEDWQNSTERSFPRPSGTLEITSNIPLGAGLGSSAALCVALTRWLAEPLGISPPGFFEFARTLEHRFHGKSSGMDVAVASFGEPIAFGMQRGARSLGIKKLPHFSFHDSGMRTRTNECVLKVEKFREDFPLQAMKTDELMGQAARLSMEGLIRFDQGFSDEGLKLIAEAMGHAQESFLTWCLVPDPVQRLIETLLKEGAMAAKLTGAGGGGFVVALWKNAKDAGQHS